MPDAPKRLTAHELAERPRVSESGLDVSPQRFLQDRFIKLRIG